MMMVMMNGKDLNHFDGTGLFLVGVVIRQHCVHVLGCMKAVIKRVIRAIGHAVLGGDDRLNWWNADSRYLPSLLMFRGIKNVTSSFSDTLQR